MLQWDDENCSPERMSSIKQSQSSGSMASLRRVFRTLNRPQVYANLACIRNSRTNEDLFVESLRRYFDVLMARGHLTKQPLGWTNVESFLKVCYGSWGQKGCFSVNS